jgi:hypothetical protein
MSKVSGLLCCLLLACASTKEGPTPANGPGETVRSPAPPVTSAAVSADPSPSTVVVHVTILEEALLQQLESHVPKEGAGETELLKKTVPYRWARSPLGLAFDRGRLILKTTVTGTVTLLGERSFPIDVKLAGEPIITADYQARLQSLEVFVKARGPVDRANAALDEHLTALLQEQLSSFKLDVRPILMGAYERIARPMMLPVPGDNACALLRIVAIEAGPTVLAGGVEKDFGVVVMPAVTLPCEVKATDPQPPLPPLANVAALPSGPFQVTIPIAAQYAELSHAMDVAMGGKLHFSKEHPGLYLEKPQVYASNETLVIRLNLGGYANAGGFNTPVDGELFLKGHPAVVDNQIIVPDLELTPGTSNALLKLKFSMDGAAIRDQAQQALRVDLAERLAGAKDKMGRELSFDDGRGCVQASVLRTEVTGIHPHKGFLRIYAQVWAQVSLSMPCPNAPAASPVVITPDAGPP